MAGLLIQETNKSVDDFINSIENKSKQQDARILKGLMEKISGAPAKIWGDNFIIAFGKYSYTRKGSKQEFEWFNLGFAPRKTKITLYFTTDLSQESLISKLGKCKVGKGCLYINKLDDIDLKTLEKLIQKHKDTKW